MRKEYIAHDSPNASLLVPLILLIELVIRFHSTGIFVTRRLRGLEIIRELVKDP